MQLQQLIIGRLPPELRPLQLVKVLRWVQQQRQRLAVKLPQQL
jgi:hypothetical protein